MNSKLFFGTELPLRILLSSGDASNAVKIQPSIISQKNIHHHMRVYCFVKFGTDGFHQISTPHESLILKKPLLSEICFIKNSIWNVEISRCIFFDKKIITNNCSKPLKYFILHGEKFSRTIKLAVEEPLFFGLV